MTSDKAAVGLEETVDRVSLAWRPGGTGTGESNNNQNLKQADTVQVSLAGSRSLWGYTWGQDRIDKDIYKTRPWRNQRNRENYNERVLGIGSVYTTIVLQSFRAY